MVVILDFLQNSRKARNVAKFRKLMSPGRDTVSSEAKKV